MDSLATIINYCTNDFRYIDECIRRAKEFSKQIIIPVCDHFFNGEKEDRKLLQETYLKHPDCEFVEFAYLPDRLYSPYHKMDPEDPLWSMFWGATSRYIGYHYVKEEINWVLFLDTDEIFEPEPFRRWFEQEKEYEAYRLAAYYYALKPTFRAKNVVNLSLLVQKKAFSPVLFFNDLDRLGAFQSFPGKKREKVLSLEGLPLIHHYSWVKTKEECIQKTRTWGHRHDEDWESLIEKAFAGDVQGLFGTTHEFYEIDQPFFDPFKASFHGEKLSLDFGHVKRIGEKEMRRKEVESVLF